MELPEGGERTGSAVAAVAVLADDLRRGMYEFIRRARRPVGRDEAAAAVGISRKLAAFHLDKLVDAGLLCARFEPVGGIRKVGRTPKVYEPADTHIGVSIPPRRPDLLADVLLDAVLTEGEQETAAEAAMRTARERGHRLGTEERDRSRPGRLGAERTLTKAEDTLAGYGFEPDRETPTCVRLRNCPFHPLTAKSPELVCGLNHAFLRGFLAGLQARSVEAVLEPRPGECCVTLRTPPEP
ncbi:putative ArsR family transcriptional regulator [Saccharopolyspora erythraea NRRL 2338]|uniref:Transcriptional regulator n=2 Tax=Saccharopolyspora erythraea TaxID=1836 RepID=A4FIT6_SACEN|nr:transcriptional regulator [Saccharopolyspora erythraea]EQD83069.1 transcriptional regulator [Saccharopolyspora erythraea D]PFG97634.1 putative ArsR family transcriptional regulator [Saccharopolyspora erythraea NRRL 2338]QRK87791.1 transcriptional regulator [Saccharopolyspora erythraea]CAM03961.1 putative transcriptional regulator [Saccharopolyspora erythraea NRRL 2338]